MIKPFFNINLFSLLICLFILILPSLHFSNAILTESISFSFCLIISGLLIDLIYRTDSKTLILIVLFFIVSCLFKPQLLFVFGVLIFVSIFFVFIKKIKLGLFITLLAFLSLVVIFNANKFYHLLNHDGFQIDTNLLSNDIFFKFFMTMNLIDWVSFVFTILIQFFLFSRGQKFIRNFINFSALFVYLGLLLFFVVLIADQELFVMETFISKINLESGFNDFQLKNMIGITGTLFAYFSILIMNFGDYSRYVKSSRELLKGNLSLVASTLIYSFLLLVIVIGADIFF